MNQAQLEFDIASLLGKYTMPEILETLAEHCAINADIHNMNRLFHTAKLIRQNSRQEIKAHSQNPDTVPF